MGFPLVLDSPQFVRLPPRIPDVRCNFSVPKSRHTVTGHYSAARVHSEIAIVLSPVALAGTW
ncbi:hypothetical protein AA103193_2175 [Tanticharoenia sakaeratensis NBRC 103193]|jgi:hypothetical protein|nr:hypothetical protein AA103193_2175 [Tanticharoenia sakaeratensis NBRC 103193]